MSKTIDKDPQRSATIDKKKRSPGIHNDRQRSTRRNDRQGSITIGNDRQRTGTNDAIRAKILTSLPPLASREPFCRPLRILADCCRSFLLSIVADRCGSLSIVFFLALGVSVTSAQIRIGAVSCLTGARSTFGISSINGARMAAEEANAAGGVNGQKIGLIVEDNQSKAGETATIARKFLSQDKVVAILGDLTSSSTMEAAPLAQAARVPLLTPTATAIQITNVGDYIFRSCFIDPFMGQVMARFAFDKFQAKRAVTLVDVKQDYSVGVTEAIRKYFTERGGQILREISYSSGDSDFRAQLSATKAARPDVIFLPGYYTEAALILRQANQLGIKAPIIGGEGWDSPALLEVAGKSAEGQYYANHFSAADPSEQVQRFVTSYKEKFGGAPDALAALWYDGARLLFDAIARAGEPDPIKIRDALAATKDFPGVTGAITMDAHRNASKPVVVLTIENGETKVVQQVKP
jgi:branched-chain amino acid transport system substrate-binding protein